MDGGRHLKVNNSKRKRSRSQKHKSIQEYPHYKKRPTGRLSTRDLPDGVQNTQNTKNTLAKGPKKCPLSGRVSLIERP
jgi:hypothetical protein